IRSWKSSTAKIVRPAVVPSRLASASTGITMAVDDRASAKPSTVAEVGGSPRIKAKVPSAAAEPKTCIVPSPKRSRPIIAKRCHDSSRPIMNRRKTTPNSATGAICSTLPRANGADLPRERAKAIGAKQNTGAKETQNRTELQAPEQRHDDARRREKNQCF